MLGIKFREECRFEIPLGRMEENQKNRGFSYLSFSIAFRRLDINGKVGVG